MKLNKHENIITAFAESARGPGWANSPIWVIIRCADGTIRQECLQPRDQTVLMRALYNLSQSIHLAMVAEVERGLKRRNR